MEIPDNSKKKRVSTVLWGREDPGSSFQLQEVESCLQNHGKDLEAVSGLLGRRGTRGAFIPPERAVNGCWGKGETFFSGQLKISLGPILVSIPN